MFIQNQRGAGKQAKRWDRTGIVTEDVGNDKYTIRVDGSGRVLSRNRRYLRSFKPALPQPTMPSIASKEHVIPYGRGGEEHNIAPNSVAIHDDIAPNSVAIPIVTPSTEHPQEPVVMQDEPAAEGRPVHVREEVPAGQPSSVERRSSRTRKPNTKYSAEEYDLSSVESRSKRKKGKDPLGKGR